VVFIIKGLLWAGLYWGCGEGKECYSYMHKISEIVNSLAYNGIAIEKMEEYNFGCGVELVENIKKPL